MDNIEMRFCEVRAEGRGRYPGPLFKLRRRGVVRVGAGTDRAGGFCAAW